MTNGIVEPISSWNYPGSALIISLEELERRRDAIPGVLALTSGGYSPVHTGHISLITDTKKHLRRKGESASGVKGGGKSLIPDDIPIRLVVVVNNDAFLERKHGKAFMDHKTRCQIMAGIRNVDYVVPFYPSNTNDNTVCEAINRLRPHFFIKGGDRFNIKTIPEWNICLARRTRIVTGIGQDKLWSSSDYLKSWIDFFK